MKLPTERTFSNQRKLVWAALFIIAACVTGIAIQPRIGAATSPSGVPMPVGNLNGWKQVFADDFTTDVPLGSFPGANTKWSVGYTDNTPDTAGKTNGGKSVYYPSKVLSVSNGSLDMYLHSEGGKSMGAAPMPKLTSGWPYSSMQYGRYAVRFRADSLKGFKTAWLLWPDSDVWSDGEIDFPEGDLAGTIGAFSHCVGNPSSNCLAADSGKSFGSWHTGVIEWIPGKVTFILDGTVIGSTTKSVPSKSMHYILQTESCLTGCPTSTTAGHLQLDWITLYSYSPSTTASSPNPTSTAPATIAIPGDLNNDGKVNAFDLSILLSHWGTAQGPADIDGNGTVNVLDLSVLLMHWTG